MHEIKRVIVLFSQWHRNSGQCEQSSQPISDNSLLERTLVANLKSYFKYGVLLLDAEESGLKNITIRVAEQVQFLSILMAFTI